MNIIMSLMTVLLTIEKVYYYIFNQSCNNVHIYVVACCWKICIFENLIIDSFFNLLKLMIDYLFLLLVLIDFASFLSK